MRDTAARTLVSVLYGFATIGFVASGIGTSTRQDWSRPVVVGSAVLSAVTVVLFWDGRPGMIVQKGLVGLLIDGAILIGLLVLG